MKTILVPTDFSIPAQMAAETAINIAKTTQAELILLHVVDQPTSESFNIEGEVLHDENWQDRLFTLKLIEKAKEQLAKASETAKQSDVTVTTQLRMGNPYHGIGAVINDRNVDLVVMGTAGHSALDKMLIGSNTEKVVRHARCPVMTVHRKPITSTFKNIVYATAMMDDEDVFSKVVTQIQELYDATLHIVLINTPASFKPDSIVKRDMQDFAQRLHLKNYTLNVFNDYSKEDGILRFADSIHADLIAMATHGRTGLSQLLSGSIAESVANQARRPVLTAVVR